MVIDIDPDRINPFTSSHPSPKLMVTVFGKLPIMGLTVILVQSEIVADFSPEFICSEYAIARSILVVISFSNASVFTASFTNARVSPLSFSFISTSFSHATNVTAATVNAKK